MLSFVEAISLAGDRTKQNDDALGFADGRGWVLDGATDLHEAPLSGWPSDAAWIAHFANGYLHGARGELRACVREASAAAAAAFARLSGGRAFEKWRSPISSLLMLEETGQGVRGVDLGDSRVFALDADGAVYVTGGPQAAADNEAALAARQTDADKPLLRRASTIEMLRRMRAELNRDGASWTFGLDPACADHAREWAFALKRPAHLLLMTDGYAALADRYRAYDAPGLVRVALERGLHELGRELRAIETEDAGAAKHPRFKASDDATALLLRLS
ncbi:MAG: protein phosphatase 2C domain-containing protein [Hyphomonadaceae bacterium]|nr:protein phosphatase 2C domain-containing protein [Hyphomonadaceae bacterium]